MIDIKLDTHAVRQLFPEGTSARANLQTSVINNIVKEMVLKDTNNKLREAVQQEVSLQAARIPNVNAAVKEELKKFFEKKGWREQQGTFELDRVMSEEAGRVAREQVRLALHAESEKAYKAMQERIEHAIKVEAQRYEEMIVSRLNRNFGDIIDKAIAAKLASIFPVEAKA